jgi:hypothetical protein
MPPIKTLRWSATTASKSPTTQPEPTWHHALWRSADPQDAVYTLTTTSILGFDEAITLDATGIPAGASSVWGANPITSDRTTTLTVYDTHLATAGSYPITVTALSPSRVHAKTVQLELFDATPGTPTLLTPPTLRRMSVQALP